MDDLNLTMCAVKVLVGRRIPRCSKVVVVFEVWRSLPHGA